MNIKVVTFTVSEKSSNTGSVDEFKPLVDTLESHMKAQMFKVILISESV